MPKKCVKKAKIWFFQHTCYSKMFRITKFGMSIQVPPMNTHVNFQKPRFNSFGDIQFWNFSKFWDSLIFDIFFEKNEKYVCQFCINEFAYSYEVYPPNSQDSEGYNDPKRLQNVSKLKKTGPKILLFWTP